MCRPRAFGCGCRRVCQCAAGDKVVFFFAGRPFSLSCKNRLLPSSLAFPPFFFRRTAGGGKVARWLSNLLRLSPPHSVIREADHISLFHLASRYTAGDKVERWLNDLLCLDAAEALPPPPPRLPHPDECQLYYVQRDTLFSFHKVRA